jgi:tetratricopeptide (TPR) repeat protein
VERGDVFQRDGVWDRRAVQEIEVPRSIRSAVGERVSRLSDQTQGVLHEASVLGQVFGFDDLLAMSGRAEEEVEEALDEALAAMLIRATSDDVYAFNHALTQQTLYSGLSPRRRNRWHAAIGEALECLPESTRRQRAAQIAWHFLQADRAERALPFTLLAGDEAEAVYAHSEAAQHYHTALDLAQDLNDQFGAAEALLKLGTILRRQARYDEALAMLERAASLSADVGDVAGEVRAIHELGLVQYYRGRPEDGIERIREAEAALMRRSPTVEESPLLADLYAALALDLWPLARNSQSLVAAERAVNLARQEHHSRSRAVAEGLRGMALTMVGPLFEARRVLDEATELLRVVGDTWWMANAVGNVGRAFLDEGDVSNGRECLERSRALIDPWHDRDETAWTEGNLGEACFLVGRWGDARATYEGAIRMARDVHSQRHLSLVLVHLAELSAVEGKWEEASSAIDEGLEIAATCGAVPALRKGQRLLAEHDLAVGRAEQAVNRLQPLLASAEGDWPRAFPPPVLAEAYLALGEVNRAEELVLQRVQRFWAQSHRRALSVWLRVQGMLLGQLQRWEEAEGAFTEAVSLARVMPYPYAEGRALHESGVSYLQRGERERARRRLEEALAIFRRLGARPDVERTEQILCSTPD